MYLFLLLIGVLMFFCSKGFGGVSVFFESLVDDLFRVQLALVFISFEEF